MADLVYVLVMVGFFALAAAFVVACERIVGSSTPYDAQRADAPVAPPPTESKPGKEQGKHTEQAA